jgi:ubiquitin carboxyl-terminal hydrolase 5/13
MSCTHATSESLNPPGLNQPVYREDCTQCFDSVDDRLGIDVCLSCFNGGCPGERNHSLLHVQSSGHPLVLNIKRTRKQVARDEPPQKMSKLSIAAETEEDKYDTNFQVKCYECGVENIDASSRKLYDVVQAVLKSNTFSRQEEIKAWEQELTACGHTLYLEQQQSRKLDLESQGKCSDCDLRENLWLCMECGSLGCGRAQFGGIGGNSHALAHSREKGHAVAVKLGSLTADGNADVYCYYCDDERVDPEIAKHLAHWGINIADRKKTEKSMTEMQIEQNLRWEFSMTTEDGKEMGPIFGKGFTGLKNLGNSCYMDSVLQVLFSIPEFQSRYYHPNDAPPSVAQPAEDLETQVRKIADGLLSGRYSKPDKDVFSSDESAVPHQKGLAPSMFKALVGRGHAEFSTMRQQDSSEFLLHLFQLIERSTPTQNPVESFKSVLETRLQCNNCHKVRYRTDEQENITVTVPQRKVKRDAPREADEPPKDEYEAVTLEECLNIFTAPEPIDDVKCSSCGSKTAGGFSKRQRFRTFPQVLAVTCHRYGKVNGVTTKLDVPVVVTDEPIKFDSYFSSGPSAGELLLPDDDEEDTPSFVPNTEALSQLQDMGFPRVRCEKALHATGNSNPNEALNWLMEHMEDPDIDTPLNLGGSKQSKPQISQESIDMIGAMGFNAPQARQALKETNGNVEVAIGWLLEHPDAIGDFGEDESSGQPKDPKREPGSSKLPAAFQLQSIICHKGTSMHSG